MNAMAVCASHSPLIDTVDGGPGGAAFLAAVEEARRRVEDYDPELVVFFGPDHSRALQNLVPAATVVTSAVGYGDWGTPQDPYVVDADAASGLARALLEDDFDVALGQDIRIDHGFGQTFVQLFGALGARPCLPVVLNCARPPLSSVRRVADLGRAVGRHLSGSGSRILYVGSGGLSHQPPSMSKAVTGLSEEEREAVSRRTVADAARFVNPAWDQEFLTAMVEGDWSHLRGLRDADLDAVGTGTHEIRTWVAAWAASSAQGGTFVYEPVPEWITGMGIAVSS
ncbi:MAG: 3-carboxyethylcatechol 2,3-dioxygenase [Nocardioidaceae bacterium]|nr:3-carboxyethylcatechol 2,3-dioxygenase [Nocardioidaceae bacterium]